MPVIIEGGSRSAGWWWAAHLQNTEKNERAELVDVAGLDSENLPELFREMRAMASGSKATNYFYQANINPRADEHLTPEQWHEAVDTLGHNLGLGDQPYFVIEHEKEGRTHRHAVWLRVDLETMKAIPDSLTAKVHERTSRELEIKFDLERGKSILVPDREFERPERRAQKHERFRGAQNGIDPHAIGNELKALRERSDNGQSFRVGMDAAGYVLARGDRRDFVVVDRAGGDHNLARRLGMKVAELRTFLKDVDLASLPSVAEAKTRQYARQAAHEARQKHGRGGQGNGPERDGLRPDEPQNGRGGPSGGGATAKPERPLNPTQGDIRAAWTLSHTGEQLTEALAARGIGLAQVSAEEARANQRARAFAKEIGRFVRPMREGEIVAVNGRGHVYHFDPRTVGVERGEIAKRLAGTDAAGLLNVGDTKEAMREASRMEAAEARRVEREKTRPATRIEQKIIDCDQRARLPAGIVSDPRLRGDEGESVQLHGPQALAAALDQAGIAVVRATAADVIALDALRHDEELARLAADIAYEARHSQHFAALEAGDVAAVDRFGNVHRLNPHKLDLDQLASRLIEAAPDGNTGARLASVTEARAGFEIARDEAAALRQERADLRMERAAAAVSPAPVQAGPVHDHGVRDADDIASRAGGSLMAAFGKFVDFLADMIAPAPPPTPEQAKLTVQAAEEQAAFREDDAKEAQHRELLDQIGHDRLAERLEEQLRRDLADRQRARGEDYARGRERDR
jgi:hypothetical protein